MKKKKWNKSIIKHKFSMLISQINCMCVRERLRWFRFIYPLQLKLCCENVVKYCLIGKKTVAINNKNDEKPKNAYFENVFVSLAINSFNRILNKEKLFHSSWMNWSKQKHTSNFASATQPAFIFVFVHTY